MRTLTPATRRRRRGAAIAEFAPAFMLFFLFLFFPFVNYLALALSYGCGAMLNYNCVREASLVHNLPPEESPTGTTTTTTPPPPKCDIVTMEARVASIVNHWAGNGFGKFVKLETAPTPPTAPPSLPAGAVTKLMDPISNVSTLIIAMPPTTTDTESYVQVTQSMQISPFLFIGFFPMKVPGINAPMPFVFSDKRMIENG